MLEIRVLGPLRAGLDGRPLELRGRRVAELLGWLALHPGPQPRARIAGVFWPDVPDGLARTNLRQITWDLRRALGPAAGLLAGDKEHLGLVSGPELRVDAEVFARHVAAGRHADALALVTGDLLEGLDGEWLDAARSANRRVVSAALSRLADAQERAGDPLAAAGSTRRLLELDPYDEPALRLLLRRLDRAGRRAEAVQVADAYAARLAADLGVAPSPATAALVTPLRRPPTRTGRIVLRAAAGGLVGREADLAALEGLLERARAGGQALCGVEGDAGIGKTALVAELAARASAAGAVVLAGRATEDELVPYRPWVEALRNHLSGRTPEEIRAQLPAGAEHLLAVLPELAGPLGTVGPGGVPDRLRMFAAVTDWLHGLAADRTVLVVLDDLHTADPASLELLRHVAGTPTAAPLVVVFTCRPRVESTAAGYAGTLSECGRHGLRWTRLRGLDVTALGTLVERVTDRAPAPALARDLHVRTGGNPFFATEVVRSLRDAGALRVEAGSWVCEPRAAHVVPDRVRLVLAGRLSRLAEAAQRVVEAGAVVGMEFAGDLVGAALGVAARDLLDPLDSAVGASILVEHGAPGGYAFAHPLVREAVYTGLTANRRAWLHERVGEELDAAGAPESTVVRHLLDAGTPDAVRRAGRRGAAAAGVALEQGGWEDARALIDRLLARAEVEPEARRALWAVRGVTFAPEWALAAGTGPARVTQVVPRSKNPPGAASPGGGMSAGATSPASS